MKLFKFDFGDTGIVTQDCQYKGLMFIRGDRYATFINGKERCYRGIYIEVVKNMDLECERVHIDIVSSPIASD